MQTSHVVVVVPTYNERGTIEKLLHQIFFHTKRCSNQHTSVIVVDDSSPDGTGSVVKRMAQHNSNIHLIQGHKEGLGVAYKKGYHHALHDLQADVVVGMDADLSHDPSLLPTLIAQVENGADLAIGSRYAKGGSLPEEWSLLRRINSKVGNFVARYIGGIKKVGDCTSAYRAMSAQLLKSIPLRYIGAKGYVFLVGLLHHARKQKARICEIPIQFKERSYGSSKLSIQDVVEFIQYCFSLRLISIKPEALLLTFFILVALSIVILFGILSPIQMLTVALALFSTLVLAMSLFHLFLMLYHWENADRIEQQKVPRKFLDPTTTFTAVIPARHETEVILDTIDAVQGIDYPDDKKKCIVVCRSDDTDTIQVVQKGVNKYGTKRLQLLIFDGNPINKPHGLNVALKEIESDVTVIFDAEDQPHENIYHVVNTLLQNNPKTDVVQAGVQLMNYNSHWFSSLNVLEYFFWFKSSLHFFASQGLVPLGGNTFFFRTALLREMGGWDESCLTEDADIGIRMSAAGAQIRVVYEEDLATQEETPHSVSHFIKQRTRWMQGFLQIFLKGEWLYLPTARQKLLAMYILLIPFVQSLTILIIPIMIYTALSFKLTILVALYTFVPLLLLFSQLIILNIGLFEFTRRYKLRYSLWGPFKLLIFFLPYQMLLTVSAVRSVYRLLGGLGSWEKTQHLNMHRSSRAFTEVPAQ